MRLIVMGQLAFGQAVLEALLERGDDVVAVYCAPDKEGRPLDPIKEFALEKDLPVYQPASYKDEATLDEMRALKADLCLMAYVIVFVPETARDVPTHGSICFHPSLLPLHRGPSSINWPTIGGAAKTGLTIFYPNDGLDEGDILLQKEVEIGPDDTLGTVYFNKTFQLGVDAMLESVDLIAAGKAPRIPQDESQATYESWCKRENAEIDWNKPADEVYNLIRGTNPQPGAWTTYQGKTLQIFDSAKVAGTGQPGEVVEVTGENFTVTAQSGAIQIQRVRPEGGGKIAAGEFRLECWSYRRHATRLSPVRYLIKHPKAGQLQGTLPMPKSDIEIAREASMRPIAEVGEKLGIPAESLIQYGPHKAKVSFDYINSLADRPVGKLILTTAITPTPAGEGKTTTTVGLGDALNRIGKKAAICLREPSLGPCFGVKGGAAGGGYAQVVPMEDINLHFTGDFHAIGAANNLLAALIDNHIYWGNKLDIDTRRIGWRRVVDMNDRALRSTVCSLGGAANGFPREDGFDITVASEVMAIFCLAKDLKDLEERLGKIVIGQTSKREPVLAEALKAPGPMSVLLKDAIAPNLVPNLREQPGLHPRRAVCQHRPWLQLGDRHQDGAETGRLCGDRGRLRRGPGGGEVLQHQMPQGRPQAGRGGACRHRARAQDARWGGQGRAGQGERGGGQDRLLEPVAPPGEREAFRRAAGGRDQPLHHR